jgi:hypothetical protein
MSNISRAIKAKTDAQLRLLEQESKTIIKQTPTGEVFPVTPQEYQQTLAAGKNITITTSGNIKTINAIMNLLGGSNITISTPDSNGQVTITAALPQATESVLGGVKVKAKTTETAEVAIDTTTGKLYAPAPSGASVENQRTNTALYFWVGTEAQFAEIITPDANTIYFRSDA